VNTVSIVSAGIVLAGGQSRRMGTDKALLPQPGTEHETFVEHLTGTLKPLCSEVVLVVRDAFQATLYSELADARIVTDRVPGVGPLMGLYSGLSAVQTPRALVTAVDMPFVQRDILAFLFAQASDEVALVPMVDNMPQVLLAVYPRSVLPLLEALLHAGRRDLRALLEVAPVRYIEEAQLRAIEPTLRSFVNVNTPGEWKSYSGSDG
jgi:molybdenum cofactor guanylyltransferase